MPTLEEQFQQAKGAGHDLTIVYPPNDPNLKAHLDEARRLRITTKRLKPGAIRLHSQQACCGTQ